MTLYKDGVISDQGFGLGGGEVKRALLFRGSRFVFLTNTNLRVFINTFPKCEGDNLTGKITLAGQGKGINLSESRTTLREECLKY